MNIVNICSKLRYLFLFPAPPPRGGLRGSFTSAFVGHGFYSFTFIS